MDRETKLRSRRAKQSEGDKKPVTDATLYAERDKDLFALVGTAGWAHLKEYLVNKTAHLRPDFNDPQWQAKIAHHEGEIALALDTIKFVEKAHGRHRDRASTEA